MRSKHWIALIAVMILSAGRSAPAWEIPLELTEGRGKAGYRYVSGGVPLLAGQAKDPGELRLARRAEGGKLAAVPAQFRVLARWWRQDNSIRWVLVDFQADLDAGEKQEYVLTNEKLAPTELRHEVTVKEEEEWFAVTTGPARFLVPKHTFAFIAAVLLDADGDGAYEESMLSTRPDCGTVMEDAFGEKYYSSESTRSVEVIERGPLRVRIRARGLHKARGGKGYSKGLYLYDYFMDFHAGSTAVFCDVVIGNNFPKSVGAPCFEDASLWLNLKDPITAYTVAGQQGQPHAGALQKSQSVCLYQDSNGAKTWQQCPGVARMTTSGWRPVKTECSSFQGYKFWQRDGDKESEIAAGNHAEGTLHVRSGKGGLIVHMRNFWQQFPKGVEAFGDGRLRIALFPREYKAMHFIEDASAKGHELVFHFYARGKAGPYGMNDKGEPDSRLIAGAWESKVLPRPARIEHIAACGALADTGPFTVPVEGLAKKPNNRTEAYGSRMLSGDQLYGNAYGWQVFGERWRSCGGHSKHGARQPMNQDDYLYRWFVTGVHGWLLNGDARSRQFRDVRAYRIEDVDPFRYKDWEHFRTNNRSEDWTRRAQPDDDESKRYGQGRYGRTTWWLPNPAHMTMDLCYDRYLLMGDQRSFENLRLIAAHGGYYAAYRKPVVHRATGWSWRACYRYWELTGDQDAERVLKDCIANFRKMVDGEYRLSMKKDRKTGKEGVNWWFTYVFGRAAAMTALHTGDPDALEICRRFAAKVADHKEKYGGYAYRDFSELHGVLWQLTGDPKYKTEGLGPDGGERLKVVTGGMKLPACAHWLLTQPAGLRR